jgi:hypothetical protein
LKASVRKAELSKYKWQKWSKQAVGVGTWITEPVGVRHVWGKCRKSYEMETSCEEPLKMKASKKGNGVQQISTPAL